MGILPMLFQGMAPGDVAISMKDTDKLDIRDVPGGAVVAVKVTANSSRDKLVGVLGDALKIATATAPERGRANRAIAEILARSLGVNRRDVAISAGLTSPHKEFTVSGISAGWLREKLERV